LKGVPQSGFPERCLRGGPVRSRKRFGDCDLLDFALFQGILPAWPFAEIFIRGPENHPSARIYEGFICYSVTE
jgi:hypothetical protein